MDNFDPSDGDRAGTNLTDIEQQLSDLENRGLYRRMRLISGPQGARVLLDGKPVLVMCSNNYLGLADHPRVREAAADAARRWGVGSSGSRLISGNMTVHRRLESRLAEFKGTEAALLFGSGYLANSGIIPALTQAGEVIFSDEYNHASIVDGCRLSRAETFVYDHGDLEHLAWGLRQARTAGGHRRTGPGPRRSRDGRRGPRRRHRRTGRPGRRSRARPDQRSRPDGRNAG
jgi:glycine C-acetyltransferase/8-amino-7-oxononanoate synthase